MPNGTDQPPIRFPPFTILGSTIHDWINTGITTLLAFLFVYINCLH